MNSTKNDNLKIMCLIKNSIYFNKKDKKYQHIKDLKKYLKFFKKNYPKRILKELPKSFFVILPHNSKAIENELTLLIKNDLREFQVKLLELEIGPPRSANSLDKLISKIESMKGENFKVTDLGKIKNGNINLKLKKDPNYIYFILLWNRCDKYFFISQCITNRTLKQFSKRKNPDSSTSVKEPPKKKRRYTDSFISVKESPQTSQRKEESIITKNFNEGNFGYLYSIFNTIFSWKTEQFNDQLIFDIDVYSINLYEIASEIFKSNNTTISSEILLKIFQKINEILNSSIYILEGIDFPLGKEYKTVLYKGKYYLYLCKENCNNVIAEYKLRSNENKLLYLCIDNEVVAIYYSEKNKFKIMNETKILERCQYQSIIDDFYSPIMKDCSFVIHN